MGEHDTVTVEVRGSKPLRVAKFVAQKKFADVAQLVEHNVANVEVVSSNLITRSKKVLKKG